MNSADLEASRRKLLWRAAHRGMKELDLVFGAFAEAHVPHMNFNDIKQFESILEISDQDVLSWLTQQAAVPAAQDSRMLRTLLATRPKVKL